VTASKKSRSKAPARVILPPNKLPEANRAMIVQSLSVGMGRALVVADAAVLDLAGPWPGAPQGLAALVESAFGDSGQNADEGGGA